MNDEIKKLVLGLYKPPFEYDGGYIWDSNHEMVSDSGQVLQMQKTLVSRIRSWGRIQYMKDKCKPEDLQDTVGKCVAEALNKYWREQSKTPIDEADELISRLRDIFKGYHLELDIMENCTLLTVKGCEECGTEEGFTKAFVWSKKNNMGAMYRDELNKLLEEASGNNV